MSAIRTAGPRPAPLSAMLRGGLLAAASSGSGPFPDAPAATGRGRASVVRHRTVAGAGPLVELHCRKGLPAGGGSRLR